MSHYGGKELGAAFRTVRKNTIQIAEDIPEDKYGFKPASETRTIAQTLAHMAISTEFAHSIHGKGVSDLTKLDFGALSGKMAAEEAKQRTKAEIITLLKSEGERYVSYVDGLSDAFLAETVAMPPGAQPSKKTRFEMLLGPKEHEMHHRGQLMTMERMVGVVPHLTRQRQEQMAARAQSAPAKN
jgi:uncharacterized damage-inducible protein DinB